MLCSVATVKSWLGITASTWDTQLATLVAGVDEEVKRYLGRNIETCVRVYKTILESDIEIVLDETPVQTVSYCATGSSCLLTLSYTGSNFSAYIRSGPTGVGVLSLVSGMTSTKIILGVTDTLGDLVTAINMIAGWTATVPVGTSTYPANCLLDQATGDSESGSSIVLVGAINPVVLARAEVEGVYRLGRNAMADGWTGTPSDRPYPGRCGTLVCVYTGGYDTADIPAGLTLEVIKICCDAWRMFPTNSAMKSESVGDYSYTKFDQAVVTSAIGPHMTALDLYRRV